MMEFMMARVSTCICAALIIGLLFAPVTDTLMDDTEDKTEENCNALGEALDRFMMSDTDVGVLSLDQFLPDDDSSIAFRGHVMALVHSDTIHMYTLSHYTDPDVELYGPDDVVKLYKKVKEGDVHETLFIERMNDNGDV
jgi:hypothetical protein